MTVADLQSHLDSLPDNQLLLLYYTISVPNQEYLLYQNYYQLACRAQSQAHVMDTIDRRPLEFVRDVQVYKIGNGGYSNNFLVNTSSSTQTHQAGKNVILTLASRLVGTEVRRADEEVIIGLGKLQSTVYGLRITPTEVGVVRSTMYFGTHYAGDQSAEYPSNYFEYAAKYV